MNGVRHRSLATLVKKGMLPAAMLEVADAWAPPGRDIGQIERDLTLPLVVEPDWPGPAAPVAVPGGWVQADLIDDDRDTFARLRATRPGAGPEELAVAAQQLRLPVLPYRRARWPRPLALIDPPRRVVDLTGVTVIDLSSLWAGPLATRLLADAGARVVKIDPDCRPDGFRARSRLYHELNRGKDVVDLDLRVDDHRRRFETLVAEADLLVHSFSRRALPNLGYPASQLLRHNPRLGVVSIVAFPLGCVEQDWLAFGSGIHAVAGLGLVGGRARPTPVAYPDPLTGYAAFAAALATMSTGGSAEVHLIDAAAAVGGWPPTSE